MKRFLLGVLLGAILASLIWFFLIKKQNDDDRRQLRNLIVEIQQQQNAQSLSERILDKQDLQLAGNKTFTLIIAREGYYFYEGPNCQHLILGSLADIDKGIQKAISTFGSELMVIVKETADAGKTEKLTILDLLDHAGLKPGQFTSLLLSNKEKDCIQSLNK